MPAGKFSYKVLTSFVLFVSFFISVISGLILYIAPAGRVANWVDWQVLWLDKGQWTALHDIFSIILIVAGLFHLFWFNWTLFWAYLKKKAGHGIKHRWELIWAVAISLVFYVGTVWEIPPVIYLYDLSEYITESWDNEEQAPPEAHTELKTIEEFAVTLGKPLDEVLDRLSQAGLPAVNAQETLAALAERFKTAPDKVFAIFEDGYKMENPEAATPSQGLGKLTYGEVVKELGLGDDEAMARMKAAGITKFDPKAALKDIGADYGKTGKDVLYILDPEREAEEAAEAH